MRTAFLLLLLLTGCASHRVSLRTALVQTVDALHAAHAEAIHLGAIGYYPCELTATFAVGVSLNGDLMVAPNELTIGASGRRGSTVTITMRSTACGAVAGGTLPLLLDNGRSP